jgi:hypothetical protein
MKCAFCGSDTEERYTKENVTVFAHFWCLEDRMTELDTNNLIDCLVFEDRIKIAK